MPESEWAAAQNRVAPRSKSSPKSVKLEPEIGRNPAQVNDTMGSTELRTRFRMKTDDESESAARA